MADLLYIYLNLIPHVFIQRPISNALSLYTLLYSLCLRIKFTLENISVPNRLIVIVSSLYLRVSILEFRCVSV